MKNCFKYILGFFALVLILILLGSLALAGTNISNSPNWDSTSPRLAVDAQGNVYAAWAEMYTAKTGDIFYSRYTSSQQQWSTPANISQSGKAYVDGDRTCDIDVDGSGRVYIIWSESEVVKFRINSGTSWGSIATLFTGGTRTNTPKVVVTSGGNIYTCWWTEDGVVRSRAKVGSSWESTLTISRGGARSKFPDISVGNSVVYATWVEKGADSYRACYTKRSTSANASWSARETLPSHEGSHQHAVVAVDPSDVAHVVWTPELSGTRIVTYSRSSGSGFTSAEDISKQEMLHYPSIAARSQVVCADWQVGAYDAGQKISYNIRQNGSWTGQANVPQSGGGSFCDVAISTDGDTFYFLWDSKGEIYFASTGSEPPPPPGNQPPIADFAFSPMTGDYPLKVTFDASASYDTDGTITAYAWSFGDGGSGSGKIVDHTYKKNGTFTIKLTVTDDKGATGKYSLSIKILKPNVNPTASFSFSPTTGIYPLVVYFNASASKDSDGQIVSYEWDFGDGGIGIGKTTSHTYQKKGTFMIQLTVTDNREGEGTKTQSITVLSLYAPLNITWQTHVDESLFQSRYVTEVKWSRNPQNDAMAQIIGYRVYRKGSQEAISSFQLIQNTDANTFSYRDFDVKGKDLHTYAVTAVDNMGHESPMQSTSSGQLDAEKTRNPAGERRRDV